MSDRADWSSFVCAPERAGRHLAALGRGAVGAYTDPVDIFTLQDFLSRLEDDRWAELLAEFLDLTLGGYGDFVGTRLQRLLDALSSEKLGELSVVGPGPRGNVQWGRTMMARKSGGLAPGKYLSRIAHRSFDLPINRVLAWLVHDLSNAIGSIKRAVRSQHLSPHLERMDALIQEALGHHWLSQIDPSENIEVDLSLARIDMGRSAYADVIALAKRRQRLRDRDIDLRWKQILDLLAVGWLEPLNDDDLFELYALVLTLDILETDVGLGAPTSIDLVRPGRKEIAKFEAGNRVVSVFFDQSFSTLAKVGGRYPALTATSPLISSHPRRPDIIVTSTDSDGKMSCVMIEVKNTKNPDYISASIYKCFGYIHDYDTSGVFSPSGPKCILLVSGNFGDQPMMSSELVVLGSDMRSGLTDALRSSLSL